MVLAVLVVALVVAGTVTAAVGSRDTARRRREWRAHAAEVRARRERERVDRFGGVPAPRESPEDSGHWLVDR